MLLLPRILSKRKSLKEVMIKGALACRPVGASVGGRAATVPNHQFVRSECGHDGTPYGKWHARWPADFQPEINTRADCRSLALCAAQDTVWSFG